MMEDVAKVGCRRASSTVTFESSPEESEGVSHVIWGKRISDRGIPERKQVKGGSMRGGSSLAREAWGRILGD